MRVANISELHLTSNALKMNGILYSGCIARWKRCVEIFNKHDELALKVMQPWSCHQCGSFSAMAHPTDRMTRAFLQWNLEFATN